MRGRVWIGVSLALNVFLAAWLWQSRSTAPIEPESPPPLVLTNTTQTVVRTNTVVRRQNFVWSDVESDDYYTYIANLRLIGCPEATIRDIIVADVNLQFARRRSTELVTPQQQWWRSTPDPGILQAATDAALALERERRDLLTELLGPDWESAEYPFPSAFTLSSLDGPVLGGLSTEVKAAVHQVERQQQDRIQSYLAQAREEGGPVDELALARIEYETRQALASLLDPEALEEYLLRYSSTAANLRASLTDIQVSPAEFRTLFTALDAGDTPPPAATATDNVKARQEQNEAALRQVLGDDRYEAYRLNQDPLYQQARAIAAETGLPDSKILPLAAIVRLTEEEELRIRSDPALDADQRLEQLQATHAAQRESLRALLGDQAYERYLEKRPTLWENSEP